MSSNDELNSRIMSLRTEIMNLRDKNVPREEHWRGAKKDQPFRAPVLLKQRCNCKEVFGTQWIDWGNDMNVLTMAAGANDHASLVVWDLAAEQRAHLVTPDNQWQLCSRIEKNLGEIVGCGGMSSSFDIYRLDANVDELVDPSARLGQHEGFITDAQFIDQYRLLTASGDSEIRLFDVPSTNLKGTFSGHTSDVNCIACHPSNPSMFISGACDFTARIWDERAKRKGKAGLLYTFDAKSRDIEGIDFFPEGNAFVAALNNSEIQFYDMRSSCKLATYTHQDVYLRYKAEQVRFSGSGRLLFGKYDGGKCIVYDTTTPTLIETNDSPQIQMDPNSVVQKLHDGGRRFATWAVSMTMHPRGSAIGVIHSTGGRTDGDRFVRAFWPREPRKR